MFVKQGAGAFFCFIAGFLLGQMAMEYFVNDNFSMPWLVVTFLFLITGHLIMSAMTILPTFVMTAIGLVVGVVSHWLMPEGESIFTYIESMIWSSSYY